MKPKPKKSFHKIAYLGLLLSFAMIISYVENIIPTFTFAPGIKLGLANGFILLILYLYGPAEAVIINLTRIILSSLLFGSMYSFLYSVTGAAFSLLIMILLYRKNEVFSPVGIGMLGGLFHNIGQILIAFLVTKLPGIIFYVPVLVVFGLAAGSVTGLLSKLLYPTLKKIIKTEKGV